MYKHILAILIAFAVVIVIYLLISQKIENFGALQSLYSNTGVQDIHLTVENDPYLYGDPYYNLRHVPWNLPTRNMHRRGFPPVIYYDIIDRYNEEHNLYW
jgi:hypothetical protein